MLGKLIKHEIKATGRVIPFLYLAIAALGLASYIGLKFNSEGFGVVTCMFMILGSAAVYVAALALIAVRFYKSMFSNEGYLTMTLPVSTGKILFTKSLVSFLWILASIVVMAGSFAAAFFMFADHQNSMDEFFQMVKNIPSGWLMVIAFFTVMLLVGSLYFVSIMTFSVTLGNTGMFNKMGAGACVLVFIVVYFCANIIEQICTVIIPLSIVVGDNGIYFSTENMVGYLFQSINSSAVTSVPVGAGGILFEIIAIVGMFAASNYLLKRKVCLK